jgi:predicted Zn-dependent protease
LNLILKFTLIGVLAGLIACTPDDQDQFATSGTSAYSSSLAPSKWPSNSNFPLNVKISSSFDSDQSDAIKNSANAWSASVADRIQFFDTTSTTGPVSSNSLSSYKDSVMGVYKLDTWPSDLPAMALAVTQIYGTKINIGSSSERIEINHADVLINYDYFTFTTSNAWGYDLETVVLHELGHFLGLYHDTSSSYDSVMYPTISRYNVNQIPKNKDISALSSKYAISSASNSRSAIKLNNIESEDQGETEEVILQFELLADGSEKLTIKSGEKHETINLGCNHSKHD